MDMTHPDLAGKVIPGWDFVDNDADPTDLEGHGTHVAGTIGVITVAHRAVRSVSRKNAEYHAGLIDVDDDEEEFPQRLGLRY